MEGSKESCLLQERRLCSGIEGKMVFLFHIYLSFTSSSDIGTKQLVFERVDDFFCMRRDKDFSYAATSLLSINLDAC